MATKQTRMGIKDAFLHDILAHPDDDAPRLIYADWLDEHDDPRGEFIRIQCALAQLSDEDPRRWPLEQRERELLHEHQAKWSPNGIDAVSCDFRRGFVDEISMSVEDFLDEADRYFEQAPIRWLHLHARGRLRAERPDASLAQAASSRHLTRLNGLRLTGLTVRRRELHEFLGSPHLQHLTTLQLSRLALEIDDGTRHHQPTLPGEIIRELIELPCFARLTALHLADTGLTSDALLFLGNAASLSSLRELNLNGNALTHGAAKVLAEGRLLSRLETLHLDSNLLGDTGALAVRDWPALPRLARLSLGHNHIFAAGMQALADAPALRELISLDLRGNIACDDGAAALASANWTRLQALNLWFNGVGDKGVRALAQSKAFSQLTRLNLTANRVASDGARALIESPNWPRLARLDLPRNDIGAEEQRRLRDRFGPFVFFWPLAV
ncbi:MAG: TIGR02996 domain-containing protein [Gemmataceae bacterium]